jgi:hypothetical protein
MTYMVHSKRRLHRAPARRPRDRGVARSSVSFSAIDLRDRSGPLSSRGEVFGPIRPFTNSWVSADVGRMGPESTVVGNRAPFHPL